MRRWLLVGLLLLAAASWLLGWSPYLKATSVSVEGARTLSTQRIIDASGVKVGMPLARVNGARVERSLTSIPRVETVRVVRGWPDRITLRITEREPLAMVGALAVDREGVRFPLASSEKEPAITVTNFTPSRWKTWLGIYQELPKNIEREISTVSLDGRDDISFKTASLTVVWGSGEDTGLKVRVLKELLARPTTFSRIDLSAPLAPTTVK